MKELLTKLNCKSVYVPNAGLKSLEQSLAYANYLICEFIKYFVYKAWCLLLEILKSRAGTKLYI